MLTRDEAIYSAGWIDMTALKTQAESIISRYQVKAGGAHALAQSLSRRNLQKFLVGPEIDPAPKVLCLSIPTGGVAVGASATLPPSFLSSRSSGRSVVYIHVWSD